MSPFSELCKITAALLMVVSPAVADSAGMFPGDKRSGRYVQACPKAGERFYGGYHYIPQAETCLSLGGYVWAEGYYNNYNGIPAASRKYYTISTYGLQANSWTDTEYGALRGYMDIRIQYRTAQEWGAQEPENDRFQVNPWTIYGQFGGFTFGYLDSRFDFYDNANVYGTDPGTIGDQLQIPLVSYTSELKNGWSVTASLEDANERNSGVSPVDAGSSAKYITKSKNPDIVVAIGTSGNWGRFQLSGALHHVGVSSSIAMQGSSSPRTHDYGSFWGGAAQVGIMFNLPQIAAGDTLYLQSAYVEGAVSYLGMINASGLFSPPDAFLSPDGKISRVTGWNTTIQYLHNFNAHWNTAIFGGYASFELNNRIAEETIGASGGFNYNMGGNIVWQPNSAFNISVQYEYNIYGARNYKYTGYGLPARQQGASQLLVMTQVLF